MSSSRTFFKRWALASAVLIVLIIVGLGPTLMEELGWEDRYVALFVQKEGGLPMPCTMAKGVAGQDYTADEEDQAICWYPVDNFFTSFPEFDRVYYPILTRQLYRSVEGMEVNPWYRDVNGLFAVTVAAGVGIPLISLVIGLLARAILSRRQIPTEP